MNTSSAVAQQIGRTLIASGVTDVVLAPGSRSAPLVYALAPLAEAGLIRTHVRIDERDAGFLALGLARGLRVGAASGHGAEAAVALVTTSGSAVANLHPAVLEASYGHLPLVAITADRPARLRATGANQTIDDQSRVLSDLRARYDLGASAGLSEVETSLAEAVAQSLGHGGLPGPVQFNVQFDVPLVPTAEELVQWRDEVSTSSNPAHQNPRASRDINVEITPGTIIVAGDAGGHPANSLLALAEEHSLPVLAEPSSPLVAAKNFIPRHARVLADNPDLRASVETVLVHGKPTLSRPVAALLADESVTVQRLPDDVDSCSLEVRSTAIKPAAPTPTELDRWLSAGRSASASASSADSLVHGITDLLATSAINLFAASSNTIRYLGEVMESGTTQARIHASRGLAGIDGLVSTATGLSLAFGEQVVLLIGDIAMLHDVGGLLTPSHEDAGDVIIVVLNDDGGEIFGGLEHSQEHVHGYLDRYFTVPHGRRFGDLASAYGWDYASVSTVDAFAEALATAQQTGRVIIEVTLD